jgi:ubiquinone/menaquinone biosynthesis C-methylase UbiE
VESKVRAYFQKSSHSFDSIYAQRKELFQRLTDFLFHRVIQKRFQIAFQEAGELTGKTFLDIGCGSGRYLLEAAKRGASQVVGIDFAESMLRLAQTHLKQAGFNDLAKLIRGDFLSFSAENKYTIVVGIGYFDYVSHPYEHLKQMRHLATDKIIISFPKKWTIRTIIRKIRLTLAGCPVFFYTKPRISALLKEAHLDRHKIINLSRDYIVVVEQTARGTD